MAKSPAQLLTRSFLTLLLVWVGLTPAVALAAEPQADVSSSDGDIAVAEPVATPVLDASVTRSPVRPIEDPHGLSWRYLSASQKSAYDRILACVEDRTHHASIPNVSKGDLQAAYGAVKADHPEHWELESYSMLANDSGGYDVWPSRKDGDANTDARLKAATREFLDTLPPEATDYEKAKAAYEWVALHTAYDLLAPHGQDARGPLLDGKSVCAGYAAAFAHLCREAGVRCTVITGDITGLGLHAWNLVEIEDTPTYVDATWGDMYYVDDDGKRHEAGVGYDYLCLTSEEMLRDRTVSRPARLPAFGDRAWDYYALSGTLFDAYSEDAVKDAVRAARDAGARRADVKFNSKAEYDRALEAMCSGELMLYEIVGESVTLWPGDTLYTIGATW